MALKNSLNKIKSFILARYKDNLAAILIFGTANTGPFREGKSDIDTIILVKQQKKLDFDKEIKFLLKALKSEKFATQYFHMLNSAKQRIEKRNSWGLYTAFMAKGGSRVLYSTPDFEELKKWFEKHPFTKEEAIEYLQRKLKTDLDGNFKGLKGYNLMKALFTHIRKQLQIINYFQTGKLLYDYNSCLRNINLSKEEKRKLKILESFYEKRKGLGEEEGKYYDGFARDFTNKIVGKLN